MKYLNRVTLLGMSLLMMACGSTRDHPVSQALSAAIAQIDKGESDPLAVLTPKVVEAVQQPFILVSVPDRDAKATMVIFAQTDGRLDWRGGDGRGIVTYDDIIIATRGFGADLFLAEPGDLRRNLVARAGSHQRIQRYLDGQNHMQTTVLVCTIAVEGRDRVDLISREVETTRLRETCHLGGESTASIENLYWIAGKHDDILQSYQWIGPEVGFVVLQHLVK